MSNNKIHFDVKMTSEVSNEDELSFLKLFNFIFNEDMSSLWFDWKYRKNIYGDSIHVFCYDDKKLIGIRCFWRNDLNNQISYQPCDTAVLEEYRKMGIFSQMSKLALEKSRGSFIYNFPNENSLPANLKLGWQIYKKRYLTLNINEADLNKKEDYIDGDYLKWRFVDNPNNKYYYSNGKEASYLLLKRKNGIYYYLGNFDPAYNHYFQKKNFGMIFKYVDKETLFYKLFKNNSVTVFYDNRLDKNEFPDIPMNKADYF